MCVDNYGQWCVCVHVPAGNTRWYGLDLLLWSVSSITSLAVESGLIFT